MAPPVAPTLALQTSPERTAAAPPAVRLVAASLAPDLTPRAHHAASSKPAARPHADLVSPPPFAPASGYLSVERPAQAVRVSVDGVAIGLAPIDAFELSPGAHDVVLAYADATPPVSERVSLRPGERRVLRVPAADPTQMLFQAAQDAYIRRDCRSAVANAQAYLAADHGADAVDRALRLIGSCRCIQHDAAGAAEAARALRRPDSRDYLRYVCARNGTGLQ
jgi:hypothetical protein